MHPAGFAAEISRAVRCGLLTPLGLALLIAAPVEAGAKARGKRSVRPARPTSVEPEEVREPAPEPPAPWEPTPPEPPPAPVAVAPEPPPAPVWLELSLGAALGGRFFGYTEPITPNLRPYQLGGAPLLRISAVWFPLADTAGTLRSALGLSGSFAHSLGLTSALPSGDTLETSWQSFHLSLLARATPFGDDAPELRPSLGLAAHAFTFGDAGALDDELPSASLLAARPALAARFPGAVTLELEAAWLWPLSASGVAERFPHATVSGLEATIGGRGALSEQLGVGLALAYTRAFYDLRPEPGDAFVAGGALDEQVALRLELTGALR